MEYYINFYWQEINLHLKQLGYTYSACGSYTKNKERIQKFMQTGNTNYIYKNDLDKVCFQHDMAYGKYKSLTKRTESDKVLRDKAFKIASNPKYDGYERGLASMVYKFFDKKSKGSGIKSMSNQKLANELHKLIIRKFKRRRVYSSFKDNIWGADLADMQLISKHKGIRFLLCVIYLFSKYAWVVPLKDKKGINTVNAFQTILDSSKRKPNKIWVDQDSECYDISFKKWLKDNNIEIYSTYSKGKSVAAERFIRTLKTLSKNVYFDVLDDNVDKYNNTYHATIKMKPIDVKPSSFAEYNVDSNDEDPKFKIGDHVIISKYKNIFAKGYTPNWSEEVFAISKIKNTVLWTYDINDLNGVEIVGTFYEEKLQRTNQEKFRIEKNN